MARTYLQSEVVERHNSTLNWSKVADYSLDRNGPSVRPYRPMASGFAGVCIFDHLQDVAARYSDKIAVSDRSNRLTYSQLFSAVDELSRRIAAVVPAGQPVGILLTTSVWYPVAMLASMAAGRPSVPFNMRDPRSRISEIAQAARVSAVIGAGKLRHIGLPQNVAWIDVSGSMTGSGTPAQHPSDYVSVDAPSVVLYTSGSTGRPKGIVNSQRGLLQRVQQYVDACHINAEDVVMPLTGPATIAGCREILAALLTGATLHLLEVEAVGLRAVRTRMQAEGVTITYLVPTLLRALLADNPTNAFKSLRVVRIGGEKIAWTDIALLRRAVSGECLVQVGYSSTESTGSQWFLPTNLPEQGASVPVGWLLPGIAFAIVDEERRPVEPGETGELMIKSPYVLLGHWEEGVVVPAESDPDDPHLRIFATGDLVQIDDLGLLRIVGRKGRQLKINGRRVEPAELEHVLRGLPSVQDAVAIATAANELVAFAVPRSSTATNLASELGKIVKQKLPPALRPKRFHTVAEIPRLPGGKVDTAKLRGMDLSVRKFASSPQPVNAGRELTTYQLVQEVWTKILGTREISGSWSEAGGDSLKLLHCAMEVENAIGHELSLDAFTVDMTVAEMVKAIVSNQGTGTVLRPKGDSPPTLFLLCGSVGYGPSMAAFATSIAKVARVSPIRYPDLRDILNGKDTVGAMAAAAVEQIRRAQPEGDVRLLGHSLGGAVAFEVAARLLEAGRSIKFLGILDTSIVSERRDYWETLARTFRRIRTNRVSISRVACRALAKVAVAAGREVSLAGLLDRYSRRQFNATCFRIKLELQEVLRSRAFDQWLAGPKSALPIAGTVFRCERDGVPQSLGWDQTLASLDVIPIAGGHIDLVVEPHIARNRPLIERAVAQSYAAADALVMEARP